MPWIIAIGIGTLILYLIFKWDRQAFIRQLDLYFGNRSKLSEDDFYARYFEAQGIPKAIPIRIRKIFENQFDADFSRISSADDFSEEMNFI